jgi:hypothetical protein
MPITLAKYITANRVIISPEGDTVTVRAVKIDGQHVDVYCWNYPTILLSSNEPIQSTDSLANNWLYA